MPAVCVTFEERDPGWSPAEVRAWAAGFDGVFTTRPIDFKGRGGRDFLAAYQGALVSSGEWSYRKLGTFTVQRPAAAPAEVELYACRSNP